MAATLTNLSHCNKFYKFGKFDSFLKSVLINFCVPSVVMASAEFLTIILQMSEQTQFILLSFFGPCMSVSLAWVSGGNLKQSSAYIVIKLTGQWFFLIIIEL